jgi:hypothetical protein
MKRFFKNNSLSIVLFGIFLSTLVGMSIVGWNTSNQDRESHHNVSQSYGVYLTSGDFIEGVFENWESEFLQMWALVVLTVWLRQKGADDSKPLRGNISQDTQSRYSIRRAGTWSARRKAIGHTIYAHSLSTALISIFFFSFFMHAVGGSIAYNENSRNHGETERVSPISYMGTSQFWYESLQNWQSEFFSVGCLLVLSIKLRERGSPESKPVGIRYDKLTGN